MITGFLFFAHLLFALIIFTYKWQKESLSSGLLNVGLIGILFAVGWSLANIATKYVIDQKGFGLYFDRDTIGLTLLTIAEYFFYKMYYKEPEDKKAI